MPAQHPGHMQHASWQRLLFKRSPRRDGWAYLCCGAVAHKGAPVQLKVVLSAAARSRGEGGGGLGGRPSGAHLAHSTRSSPQAHIQASRPPARPARLASGARSRRRSARDPHSLL